MKTPDRWSSLFWLFFSIFICIESYRLGIGSFNVPGTGFFHFLVGIVFVMLSLLLFVQTFMKEGQAGGILERVQWKSVTLALASLFIYAIVLEKLGFVVSTLLFITVILGIIERKRWYIVTIIAVLSTAAFYVVFQVWLQSQLPKGILGL